MKKVIHLISTDVFSGAENVACQIINIFKEDKEYSEMIYVSKAGKNIEVLRDRNIPYYTLSKFNYSNISKAIKMIKPDIIHAHDIKSSIMAAIFYKDAKIISHIHANHENMRRLNVKTFLFNLFAKRFNKIIWVSKSSLEEYRFKKNILYKSIVLYNIINPEEIYLKAEQDTKNYNYDLIFLGRMTHQKNPQRLIKILSEVVKKKTDVKIALVGSGELDNEVKELISLNKIENNIDLYGFISNPYKILLSSKIMIMTSRYEGTPMCALEALSLGKPIITTPTDGLIDIIENNKSGFISNDDEELIDKILMLINDSKSLSIMSEYAKGVSDKINNTNKYKDIVRSIYED